MKKSAICVLLLFISAVSIASAQQEDVKFTVTTNPPGATIYLNGEYRLVANTPAALPSNLSGQYKTRIVHSGYESWQGELTFVPGSPDAIHIDLKMKTPFKAGLRSLFIPGWGQYYSGNKTRGGLFTLAAITSAVGLYFADKEYQDKRAEFDIAANEYSAATSIEERLRLKAILDAKQRQAYKTETDRRTVFFIGVGLWTFNLIDSVIFFPDNKRLYPEIGALDGGGAQLTLKVTF